MSDSDVAWRVIWLEDILVDGIKFIGNQVAREEFFSVKAYADELYEDLKDKGALVQQVIINRGRLCKPT